MNRPNEKGRAVVSDDGLRSESIMDLFSQWPVQLHTGEARWAQNRLCCAEWSVPSELGGEPGRL